MCLSNFVLTFTYVLLSSDAPPPPPPLSLSQQNKVFCDLNNASTYYQDNSIPLKIRGDKMLGKGGFGFVCEGELAISSQVNESHSST